jgi:excinuclease ABC subunit A
LTLPREETQKSGDDFQVYMYCSYCNYKMDKLTRSHFSFNTREGSCKTCQGLGRVLRVNENKVIHEHLSKVQY